MNSSQGDFYVCLDYSDLETTRKGNKSVDIWGNRTLWKIKAISNLQLGSMCPSLHLFNELNEKHVGGRKNYTAFMVDLIPRKAP